MWLINTYIPMASAIKSLLNIVVFVVVLVWVLQGFGIMGPIPASRCHAYDNLRLTGPRLSQGRA